MTDRASDLNKTGRWLSQDVSALYAADAASPASIWDVLVIGSGYGGAMAAAELAGRVNAQGQTIQLAVLERGNEYLPGGFAKNFAELFPQARATAPNAKAPLGKRNALFDLRLGADLNALLANGLGGGSLINAGVMEKPKNLFKQPRSAGVPAHVAAELETLFDEVRCKLGAASITAQGDLIGNTIASLPEVAALGGLKKTAALHRFAPDHFRLANITVATQSSMDEQGQPLLNACTLCGDCMTGCNVGAKKSLDTNLLRQAKQQGAQLFTGASVLSFAWDSRAALWLVQVVFTDAVQQGKHPALTLRTRQLILAAGSFGSTEILMRSQSEALQFSPQLGRKFSGNGDQIMAAYGLKTAVHGAASEGDPMAHRQVGPTITGVLDIAPTATSGCRTPGGAATEPAAIPDGAAGTAGKALPHRGFLIQEFAVPAALQHLYSEILSTCASVQSMDLADHSTHRPGSANGLERDPFAVDPQAIEHSVFLGVIGHDDANGVLRGSFNATQTGTVAAEGMLTVDWPAAKHAPELEAAHAFLNQQLQARDLLQAPNRATADGSPASGLIRNPLWRPLSPSMEAHLSATRGPVLTVHPLGGCSMGATPAQGVVNDWGLVWNAARLDSNTGINWQGHLAVLDGSILPGSLGANPALTIATLALRASRKLADHWAYQSPKTANLCASTSPLPARPSLRRAEALNNACTSPEPPTTVALSERLTGVIHLKNDPEPYWAELTLSYAPAPLPTLSARLFKQLDTLAHTSSSRLRIFKLADWQSQGLIVATDTQREQWVKHGFGLSGHLQFLNREASTPLQRQWRAWWAWLRNRGLRDALQSLPEGWGRPKPALTPPLRQRLQALLGASIKLASRAGEARVFVYELEASRLPAPQSKPSGLRLRGHKRLSYARCANPLRQLTELHLDEFPLPLDRSKPAFLTLDGRYMAEQHWALLRLVQQSHQVKALQDVLSFALYLLRLLLNIHSESFRRPDAGKGREPTLLPTVVKGLPTPEIEALEIDHACQLSLPGRNGVTGLPVLLRLTRYKGQAVGQGQALTLKNEPEKCPLLLIHGYSASGSTFAHNAIPTSMAKYFWDQGRDVWIVDLRTSAGLMSSLARWRFEDAAWADIPLAVARIKALTGQAQVDVVAHCIGAVMLSMAVLTDDSNRLDASTQLGNSAAQAPMRYWPEVAALPSSIRRLVLSQKGPVLIYSNANAARGLLTRGLSRVLPEQWLFRNAGDALSGNPLMGLIDRALNALPYSRAEWQRENRLWSWRGLGTWPWTWAWFLPWQWFKWSWHQPWVGFRHRMDMLYGRDFELAGMSDKTLAACEDLFGPLNLETLNQTAHFVRDSVITNAAGRNVFVSPQRMSERWGQIGKTLSVHGEKNGLADVATVSVMRKLMLQSGLADRYESEIFANMGHQDSLIGTGAHQVFERIEAFLQTGDAIKTTTFKSPGVADTSLYRLPHLGPRQLPRDVGNTALPARYTVMSAPQYGAGQALLMPVCLDGAGTLSMDASDNTCLWVLDASNKPLMAQSNAWSPAIELPAGRALPIQNNMNAHEPHNARPSPNQGQEKGYLLMLVHQRQNSSQSPQAQPNGPSVWQALTQRYTQAELALAYLPTNVLRAPACTAASAFAATPLCFAFASCQYPAGLLDKVPAEQSCERLAAVLRQAPKNPATPSALVPQFLLLLGDQIYADASAGLFDPVRADDRYGLPHQRWLQAAAVREIQKRVPTYMMLDDHELQDNWEPVDTSEDAAVLNAQDLSAPAAHSQWLRDCGLNAYWQYQRPCETPAAALWQHFEQAGYGFFMADTRSQRGLRTVSTLGMASILDNEKTQWHQTLALEAWLLSQQTNKGDQPKFVSTAAMLLPRHVLHDSDTLYADGWDGYPAAMQRLLAFLVTHRIQNVVFLSGDEHLFCFTPIAVFADKQSDARIRAWSIHCPGLYAPLPFANTPVHQLKMAERFLFIDPVGGEAHCCCYGASIGETLDADGRADTVPTQTLEGNGFVTLQVQHQGIAGQERDEWQVAVHVGVDAQPTPLSLRFTCLSSP
jgi:cholesterol oxidase